MQMQCRLPRKNVPNKKPSRKWYFNETISWSENVTYNADFTCDGNYYDAIGLTFNASPTAISHIRYRKHGATKWVNAASFAKTQRPPFVWVKEVYRTITFDVPPTGDLLTWLEANATPQ